jgi:two-component system, NarL family, sensor kinase
MTSRDRAQSDTQRLQQRNAELSIINTIARALNQEVDLNRALEVALRQVTALFGLETGWIFLLDAEGKAHVAAAQNLPPALADHPRRLMGTCTCIDRFTEGRLRDPQNITCSRLENLTVGTAGLRQHASIPLIAQGKPLGVLNVASTEWGDVCRGDLALLYLVGDLVAIAIERARLFTQSAELGAIEERNRIARDIHDTLAQGLTAIALQLETADALLEVGTETERIRQSVTQALHLTRQNLEEARRSVLDLRAAPLEGKRLDEAIEELLTDWARRRKVQAQFELIGTARTLPVRVEIGCYRIVQEALTNIGRHAHAKQVCIRLTLLPNHIHLMIEDDGRGFDVAAIAPDRYGLVGMNERARLLEGGFEVCSTPGQGTQLQITIPVEGIV